VAIELENGALEALDTWVGGWRGDLQFEHGNGASEA
jgi:hypothetical protein